MFDYCLIHGDPATCSSVDVCRSAFLHPLSVRTMNDITRRAKILEEGIVNAVTGYTRKAVFSLDRVYRYSLRVVRPVADGLGRPLAIDHDGGGQGKVVFVLLNPSTADATSDDPTSRRFLDFARRWCFRECEAVNLFAWRATDPEELKRADDPVGVYNDAYILKAVSGADKVVLAWGNGGALNGRDRDVLRMLEPYARLLYYLGRTQSGAPRFPLYAAKNTKLVRYGL